MKLMVVIVVIAVIVGVAALMLWPRRISPKKTDRMRSEQVDTQIGFQADMRRQLLQGAPADFGIDVKTMHKGMWGILMETGYEEGTSTLVCLCDGTASLHLPRGAVSSVDGPTRPFVWQQPSSWLWQVTICGT